MRCDLCGKESEKLFTMLYMDDDDKMLCKKCFDYECMRGDMEYERQKEEGTNAED